MHSRTATLAALLSIAVTSTSASEPTQRRPLRAPLPPALHGQALTPAIAPLEELRQHPDACALASTSCNSIVAGIFEPGDCTLTDGTYLDAFEFAGTAGDIVVVNVYPVDASLTGPSTIIIPPSTDASKTPAVFGGPFATVRYQLSSSGNWRFGVGTKDLFSSGRYMATLSCRRGDTGPQDGQNCVDQQILCGQTATWFLTSQSCTFLGEPTWLYAEHAIYGRAGDAFSVEMLSTDFTPYFGIYDDTSEPLANATIQGNSASVFFTVPRDGWYGVVATSSDKSRVGFYALTLACSRSGCITPLITRPPTSQTISSKSRATLSVEVKTLGPTTYEWFDATDLPVSLGTTTTPTFTTPELTSSRFYRVRVTTPCGFHESDLVKVNVTPDKRRAVRR